MQESSLEKKASNKNQPKNANQDSKRDKKLKQPLATKALALKKKPQGVLSDTLSKPRTPKRPNALSTPDSVSSSQKVDHKVDAVERKVVVLGLDGAGKSSLLLQWIDSVDHTVNVAHPTEVARMCCVL